MQSNRVCVAQAAPKLIDSRSFYFLSFSLAWQHLYKAVEVLFRDSRPASLAPCSTPVPDQNQWTIVVLRVSAWFVTCVVW